jgi:AraC-like DNA-binding protein
MTDHPTKDHPSSAASWYVEQAPPPELAGWVLSLWEMRIPDLGTPSRVRILPNACVDIVIYLSDASVGEGDAALVGPPHRSFVVGSTLRSFIARSAGWRHIVGVCLLPEGVPPVLGLAAREVGERIGFLHDVIGNRANEIESRVIDDGSDGALSRLRDLLIETRRRVEVPGSLIHRAVAIMRRSERPGRIDSIVDALNVSSRKLERQFLDQVGVSPKLYSRLVRFDRAVRHIDRRGRATWAQFALAQGYSDQAHFINDFREFAGVTPTEFEAEQRLAGPDPI